MAELWISTTVDRLGRIVTGKTPSPSREDYFGGDVLFVTPTDYDEHRTIDYTGRYLTAAGVASVRASRIPERAVMVTCIGSDMGKVAIAGRPCVTNQQINSIVVNTENDPLFVYYNLSTRKAELRGLARGSAQPILNKTAFGRMEILLPPHNEQRAIARILGVFDDKIELNRRISETLEAMARALFKSWFVDFDPVRAKTNGRDRTIPKHLDNLFPNRLLVSDIGEVPIGWQLKQLSQCVDVARGLSYTGAGLSTTGLPMHNLNSIYERGGYKEDGLKFYVGDYKAHHIVRAGDVIVANTEQGHDRLLIGYAAIVPARFRQETLFSHHIYRVRPKPDCWLTSDYLCHLLNTNVMHDIVSGYANGTTVNMLPKDSLQTPVIPIPPPKLVSAFSALAESNRLRREQLVAESRALAAVRDALLPKLISGELRIKDAEGFLERAGI